MVVQGQVSPPVSALGLVPDAAILVMSCCVFTVVALRVRVCFFVAFPPVISAVEVEKVVVEALTVEVVARVWARWRGAEL